MLTIEIKRTYSDRSVTRGLLIVDGKIIGATMEPPLIPGSYGKCIASGEYPAKMECTEFSPFTVKVLRCGTRFNNYLIPCSEYESLNRGICIGLPEKGNLYGLKECDKVFKRLVAKMQDYICKGDRKIRVVIYDDPLIEVTQQWRTVVDETEEDDFFNEEEWE